MSNALVYRLEKCANAISERNACNKIQNDSNGKCNDEYNYFKIDPYFPNDPPELNIEEWYEIASEMYCDFLGGSK